MKKAFVLAIAFAFGTTSLLASVYTNNHFLPPSKKNSTNCQKNPTFIKQKLTISCSIEAQKNTTNIRYLKQENNLKLATVIKNYMDISPSIISKE